MKEFPKALLNSFILKLSQFKHHLFVCFFSNPRAALYIAGQTAGAVVGAALLDFVSPPGINDSLGATFPSSALVDYKFATLVPSVMFLILYH
jgi:glycerol uptake facilitator-like aquaporin